MSGSLEKAGVVWQPFEGEHHKALSLDSTEQQTYLFAFCDFFLLSGPPDVGSVFPALLHNFACLLRVSAASELGFAMPLRTLLHGGFSASVVQAIINPCALSA